MNGFQSFAMVDWSGGNDTGPRPRKDAIWIAVVRAGRADSPRYLRNRAQAEEVLRDLITEERAAGRRLLIGFDFPFGYPVGFAQAVTGKKDPLALWAWLADRVEDAPKANNRFDLAGQINAQFSGNGPFWGNALARDIANLPRTKGDYQNPFPDRRACEKAARGTFTCWQLAGAGSVGGQVLMGLPVLARLRRSFEGAVSVWPFEPPDRDVAFVEIWPSLLNDQVRRMPGIRDAAQVHLMARALANLAPTDLAQMLAQHAPEEGWIFGLGHEATLQNAAADLRPPPLTNDCFALPGGVDWTPVDDALARLRDRLRPVVGVEATPLGGASGRVLAEDLVAVRSNPPLPNTAVDGYGFAGALVEGPHRLPLIEGRAAAGLKFTGTVPPGHAIRVLTGAALPDGVDTVILEEDVTLGLGEIAFLGPVKVGANTRAAGEDIVAGQVALPRGRTVAPADLALASAVGVGELQVFRPLRVAVLSTGDELLEAGAEAQPGQIFDANRPMLLEIVRRWAFEPVDMGRVADDRTALRKRLDRAATCADVILTSGGASAGDEDHVSALLRETGSLQSWRIALKPGRPLALGMWQGVPVFGLPGNPVAALVCALVFGRPALSLMAGAGWAEPTGFDIPAAFAKRKKAGRREYLRARVRDGRAEVFKSEGSGRISGLSWAEGLVEITDAQQDIAPGDLVRFIPFGSFGI